MSVDTKHPDYEARKQDWKTCRDVLAGGNAIRAAGVSYLPKLHGQDADEYAAYQLRAGWFGATARTHEGLTGMVFRKNAVMDLPDSMQDITADVSMESTPFEAFAQRFVGEVLAVGRVGVLVEFPMVAEQPVSLAEASAGGLRPYARTYLTESVINWKTERINNADRLSLVVLLESVAVQGKDEYDQAREDHWRVLDLFGGAYRVRVYRKGEKDTFEQIGTDLFPTRAGKRLDFIPFYLCGPDGLSNDVAKPPLLDLADANLEHYRLSADYGHGLHFTGLPTPVVTGVDENPDQPLTLKIGSATAWVFPNAEADAKYLEFTGQGLSALKEAITEKKADMALLGARIIANERRAVEAAETANIHRAGETSVLASVANGASQALTVMLQTMAWWAQIAGNIKAELNTDFVPATMDAQTLTALVAAWMQGAISWETLFWNLKQGEVVQDSVTAEDEQTRIGTPNTAPTEA
jgi:hypothetical protein